MSDETIIETDESSEVDQLEIKLRRESAAQKVLRLRRAWGVVLATPEGRAVLWDIMAMSGMAGTPIVRGEDSMTFANVGKADLGRELQAKINDEGKRWALLMLQENIG